MSAESDKDPAPFGPWRRIARLLRPSSGAAGLHEEPADVAPASLLHPERPAMRLQPGEQLGAYRVVREIGRGGMATVYLAHDLKHDRAVALKVFRPEFGALLGPERFAREIHLTAGLQHPHILPVFDSGEEAGTREAGGRVLWYAMPYVEGESLRDRLTKQQHLDIDEALRISREVADALDYAHHRGVIHRDIKPENILLSAGHALVADFGIARAITGTQDPCCLTDAGAAVGTPMYMSPEQVAGEPELDGRTDIYSLGCVLYETLTGVPPFPGSSSQSAMVERLIRTPRPLRSLRVAVPPDVERAVSRALARDRAQRFATAGEFASALSSSRAASPASALPIGSSYEPGDASIAVLPFANLSPDPQNEYFSEGMTEELINALVKISGVRVAARSSVFALRKQDLDAHAIGERLQVRTILEGSVRRAGNHLRVTAQLIDARSGYHLWSERYDREMADVFAIQDDISRTIVSRLKPRLLGADSTLVNPGTASLEAYHSYLKGRYFWNQRAPDALRKAIAEFEQAIEQDPAYSLPYSGLADAYHTLAIYGIVPPMEAYPKIKEAAGRALELDDQSAEAHTSVACAAFCYEWDWKGAEQEFRRAIQLNPSYAFARVWHAWCLAAQIRFDEAIASIREAVALEPLSLSINAMAGYVLLFCGRNEEAIEQCRRVLELDPTFGPAHEALGFALSRVGKNDEALAELRKIPSNPRVNQSLRMGAILAQMGDRDAAWRIVEEEEARQESGSAPPSNAGYWLATILTALGEHDRALAWLAREVEERRFMACTLKANRFVSALHDDPRFTALLRRMGLD